MTCSQVHPGRALLSRQQPDPAPELPAVDPAQLLWLAFPDVEAELPLLAFPGVLGVAEPPPGSLIELLPLLVPALPPAAPVPPAEPAAAPAPPAAPPAPPPPPCANAAGPALNKAKAMAAAEKRIVVRCMIFSVAFNRKAVFASLIDNVRSEPGFAGSLPTGA
jgi:hypothetical protein